MAVFTTPECEAGTIVYGRQGLLLMLCSIDTRGIPMKLDLEYKIKFPSIYARDWFETSLEPLHLGQIPGKIDVTEYQMDKEEPIR